MFICRKGLFGPAIARRLRLGISTELIKKHYQDQLTKANSNPLPVYPKTFQQKMMVLNHPKAIQLLQIVEFGVKFKPATNWLPLVLFAAAILGYLFQKTLPIRINDRYFMISPESPTYISGYCFAGLNYERPFYLYIPLMFCMQHISRFVNLKSMGALLLINCVVGGGLGQWLVNQRVSEYEVWENERICFGEGNMLSVLFCFWTMLGLQEGFTHLKSKVFLKTVPGLGIIRAGVPIGMIAVAYSLLEALFYLKGAKNSEVILAEVVSGILFGVVLRRLKPILK